MKAVVPSADGLPVHYEVDGSGGPALVFVHGWSCDRNYWRGQFDYFADRYQVVAVDLAGHGESVLGRQASTMSRFGEDVVAVVDHLGLRETVLIGHSMGGDVILEAALRLTDRVVGLVWVDVYSTVGKSRSPETVQAFVRPFGEDFVTTTREFVRRMFMPSSDPDLVEWVAADMSAAPPHVALDSMEHAITNDDAILAGLRQMATPVVAINPDYRPTDLEALERHGVRAVIMPGVGHFLMMEDPDGFNRLLSETVEAFVESRS